MIGQDKLIDKVNKIDISNFPHSIILLGESGSGKHLFINEVIVPKLNLQVVDISDSINLSTVLDIYSKPEPYIYLIDLRKLTIKDENTILKLVEEPLNNAYLILIDNNRNSIIPTILNRCQIWELENYSIETLKIFLVDKDDEDVLYFCRTPGDVIRCQANSGEDIKAMFDMIDKMINFIGNASYANVFNISDKIAFKNEIDKWNYNIFIRILFRKVLDVAISRFDVISHNLYLRTKNLLCDSTIPHINKQHLFEQYLYDVKAIMKHKVG